jgi:hypothetical protein
MEGLNSITVRYKGSPATECFVLLTDLSTATTAKHVRCYRVEGGRVLELEICKKECPAVAQKYQRDFEELSAKV